MQAEKLWQSSNRFEVILILVIKKRIGLLPNGCRT